VKSLPAISLFQTATTLAVLWLAVLRLATDWIESMWMCGQVIVTFPVIEMRCLTFQNYHISTPPIETCSMSRTNLYEASNTVRTSWWIEQQQQQQRM
jgi:hypothetical protein